MATVGLSLRRSSTLLASVLLLLLVSATAALADPAGPTHYRSTITAIESADGSDPGIGLDIVGGDAYLVIDARGRTVEIPGYEGEPYLRIAADGRVEVNDRSPARWLNDARFGSLDVEVPAGADPEAPPTWRAVANGGVWSWHDHRIHFMSPSLPAQVDPSAGTVQPVSSWEVPLEVDGVVVTVRGELEWVPGPGPAVPLGLGLVALGLVGAVGWRAAPRFPALVGVGAALTGGVGVAATASMPTGSDVEPALLVLPGVALGVLALGRWWRRSGDARAAWLSVGAGIPVGIWGLVQFGSLTRPIVPGPVPVALVRPVTAIALAVGLAAIVLLARVALEATRVDPELAPD